MMQRLRINTLLALIALTAMTGLRAAAGDDKVGFAVLKERATAEGVTPEGRAYLPTLSESMEKAFGAALRKCRAVLASRPPASLELVLTLRADGRVNNVAVSPETGAATCVAESYRSVTFPRPPREPFLVYLDLSLGGK